MRRHGKRYKASVPGENHHDMRFGPREAID